MTIISREDIRKGDLVEVVGYGGFAEVLHIEQDGYTPPPRSVPKYRVTIKWGPYNSTAGAAKRGNGIDNFALGQLRPPGYDEESQHLNSKHQQQLDQIDDMDEAQMLARLAELKASMA